MPNYIQILGGDKMGEVHEVIEEKQDRGKTFLILDDNSRMNAALLNELYIPVDGPDAGVIQRNDSLGGNQNNFEDPHSRGLEELQEERHQSLPSYQPSDDKVIPIGVDIKEPDVKPPDPKKQAKADAEANYVDPRAEGLDDYDTGKVVAPSKNAPRKEKPVAKKEEHPVIKMLNKAKKGKKLKEDSLDIVIETLLPKASLVESLTDLYEDEGLDKIAEYIMESGDLKKSIITAIKQKFNLEEIQNDES